MNNGWQSDITEGQLWIMLIFLTLLLGWALFCK